MPAQLVEEDHEAMEARQEKATAKRPSRYQRSRNAILKSATTLFMRHGYDINLDEVAADAVVSKTTLYNHFGSKQSLLEAVTYHGVNEFMMDVDSYSQDSLHEILHHFATLYARVVLSEEGIQRYKLIIADVSRFPDMALKLYKAGLQRAIDLLAAALQSAIDRGLCRPVHPARTAERFYGALTGFIPRRTFAGLGLDPPGGLDTYLRETVDLFETSLTPAGSD